MFGGAGRRRPSRSTGRCKFQRHKQLAGDAPDHAVGHFVPAYDTVARQHVRQAVGRGERRRGQGRPHQQRPALQHGGVRGRRPERPRSLLVHLAAGGVREAGRPAQRHRPGGHEEARQDDSGRPEEHLQPEDEEVLRLPGRLCARPGPVPAQLPPADGREPEHVGRPAPGGGEAEGDRPPGRARHVERDRLEHAPDVAPLLLRRVHPERGEPHRHRPGRQSQGRDPSAPGHARHLQERHDRRGLRLDRGVEQQRVPRRAGSRWR